MVPGLVYEKPACRDGGWMATMRVEGVTRPTWRQPIPLESHGFASVANSRLQVVQGRCWFAECGP